MNVESYADKANTRDYPYYPLGPGTSVHNLLPLHDEVNARMRKTESKWDKGRRETRAQYLARLRKTALRLPRSLIQNSIGDMRKRCERLHNARGEHFEEGGR